MAFATPKNKGGRPPVIDTELSAWMVREKVTAEMMAETVGAHPQSVIRWRHGGRVMAVYLRALRERWHRIPINDDGSQQAIIPASVARHHSAD